MTSVSARPNAHRLRLLALFCVAFLVRLLGVNYGYFHGDETIGTAARVLTGELVPGQHFYPPLIHYLNAVALTGLFAIGTLLDWWGGTAEFRAAFFTDPTPFYLAARIMAAFSSALMAPLFYMIACQLRLKPVCGLCVGLMAALFPLGLFMSHIAKGDGALATAVVAVFWAFLARFNTTRPARWDIALAVFVVLAVSFKQSATFILAPLFIAWLAMLIRAEGLRAAGKSVALALAVVLVLWPTLNIGILLDLENFLNFQAIQGVMSLRTEAGSGIGIATMLQRASSFVLGLNPVLSMVALLFPVALLWRECHLPHKPQLLAIWGALTLATLALASMVGSRQPEHLWIANFAGYLLLTGLLLADFAQNSLRAIRLGAQLTALCALFGLGYGSWQVASQAMATPLRDTTDRYIAEHLAQERIVTMVDIGWPRTLEAQAMIFARWDRLAARYNVEMPEIAAERILTENRPDAIFYVPMPTVMFGLEGLDEDDVTFDVQPHAWPPQRDEWQLDYWLDQDFRVFLVSNLDFQLHEVESELMRAFFRDLVARCDIEAGFEATKPLFLERDISIIRCTE